jgi:hypothetical protein
MHIVGYNSNKKIILSNKRLRGVVAPGTMIGCGLDSTRPWIRVGVVCAAYQMKGWGSVQILDANGNLKISMSDTSKYRGAVSLLSYATWHKNY